eukprot:scaffold84493_cov63-Phaeocystis_antarctica.AAC.5
MQAADRLRPCKHDGSTRTYERKPGTDHEKSRVQLPSRATRSQEARGTCSCAATSHGRSMNTNELEPASTLQHQGSSWLLQLSRCRPRPREEQLDRPPATARVNFRLREVNSPT